MAPYFRDPNLDKQDENSPGNVTVSSAGQQAGTDGTVQGPQSANQPTGSGSKFTNIDSYLNGGNAAQFGQEFGGKIQSGINDAKSNFDTTAGKVEGQIGSSGYVPTQDEIGSLISRAGDNTTDADAQKFQGWTNQTYQGPKSIADNQAAWNEYWGKANEAKTEAQESGTEPGRFALLDKYYGRPNYNFGQKSLDNLLVQTGGGFNNAADLQNQASGLQSYGQQKSDEVSNAAAQRAGQIEQSREAARSAIGIDNNNQISGGALGQFQSDLDARVAAENAKRAQDYQNISAGLSQHTLTADQLAPLGLSPDTHVYNRNVPTYLSQGMDVNKTNEASDSDYSRYLALSKLAGVDPTYLTGATRSQAGQLGPEYNFDMNRFENDASSDRSDLYHQLQNAYAAAIHRDAGGDPVPAWEAAVGANSIVNGTNSGNYDPAAVSQLKSVWNSLLNTEGPTQGQNNLLKILYGPGGILGYDPNQLGQDPGDAQIAGNGGISRR